MRVALVTAAQARAVDEDLPPLLAALGGRADVVVWDDPSVRWRDYALAVVRSTWDYAARRDEFLAWADRVSRLTRLENPAPILRWNTDKRYLRDLAVPVVPTHWIEPGEEPRVPFDGEVVVKPVVGAGSIDTARHGDRGEALVHARNLLAKGRAVMVQPYLGAVDHAGETALVYIAGAYSHAVRKGPMLRSDMRFVDGLYAAEEIAPREPSPAEREMADRVIASRPGLLYARVDLVPGPLLLEFEATEPSLFLNYGPGSADRFARAIVDLLRG